MIKLDGKQFSPEDEIFKRYLYSNIQFPQISTGIAISLANVIIGLLKNKKLSLAEIAAINLTEKKAQENLDIANKMHKAFNVQINLNAQIISEQYKRQISRALGLIEDLINSFLNLPNFLQIRNTRIEKIRTKCQEPEEIAQRIQDLLNKNVNIFSQVEQYFECGYKSLTSGIKNEETGLKVKQIFGDKNIEHWERIELLKSMTETVTTPYEGANLFKLISYEVNMIIASDSLGVKGNPGLALLESDYDNEILNPLRAKIVNLIAINLDQHSGVKVLAENIL